MKEEQAMRAIRLRLLALALALALTWYAANPAPRPARRVKRDEGPPDDKRREVRPRSGMSSEKWLVEAGAMNSSPNPSAPDTEGGVDDLEWPEVIGLG